MSNELKQALELVQECLDDWPYAATRVIPIMHRLEKVKELLLKEQGPKTGHWIFESRYYDAWSNICSECGRLLTSATGTYANYCSNCGAKMTGGEEK